jgi:3-phenylpropionate/trans-cinnamate dioxygenase ferredoxin subunit
VSSTICRESELRQDAPIRAVVDGVPVVVVKDAGGRLHALADTCSHEEISLSEGFVEGGHIECWAHGARFDLATGRALSLPATEPIAVFQVEVLDGDVVVRVDAAHEARA